MIIIRGMCEDRARIPTLITSLFLINQIIITIKFHNLITMIMMMMLILTMITMITIVIAVVDDADNDETTVNNDD